MSDSCCEGVRRAKLSRRFFVKQGGIALAGLCTMPAFLQRAIASTPTPGKKQLVVLFQRGAADGLNMVVPFAEPNYYRLRPSIAIPQPRRGEIFLLEPKRQRAAHENDVGRRLVDISVQGYQRAIPGRDRRKLQPLPKARRCDRAGHEDQGSGQQASAQPAQ